LRFRMTYPAAATPTSATTTPRTTAALKTTPRFFLAIIEHPVCCSLVITARLPRHVRELFEEIRTHDRYSPVDVSKQQQGVSRLDAEQLAGGFGDHDLPLLAYPNRARVLAVRRSHRRTSV